MIKVGNIIKVNGIDESGIRNHNALYTVVYLNREFIVGHFDGDRKNELTILSKKKMKIKVTRKK